jgi:hypothetical protein
VQLVHTLEIASGNGAALPRLARFVLHFGVRASLEVGGVCCAAIPRALRSGSSRRFLG